METLDLVVRVVHFPRGAASTASRPSTLSNAAAKVTTGAATLAWLRHATWPSGRTRTAPSSAMP